MSKHDKIARENAKTEKMQEKRHTQEEKRRNSVPPFFMVRSGLLTSWVTVLMGAVATFLVENQQNVDPNDKMHNLILYICIIFTVASTLGAGLITTNKKKRMQEDADIIRDELSEYVKEPQHILDLSRVRNFPKMTTLLVRHISRHNPGIFDTFIANPKSVPDNETLQDIIIGYMKDHSDVAPKLLQKMQEEDMLDALSYELRKRLERCTRRATRAETSR